MPEALDHPDKLFARANAAIAEARQLLEANRQWQQRSYAQIHRIYFRATFHPKTLTFVGPQQLKKLEQPGRQFQSQV